MAENLSTDESDILRVLGETFPETVHAHDLAPRTNLGGRPADFLRVLDGLLVRRLIGGKALRGHNGLNDLANILISENGRSLLRSLENTMETESGIILNEPLQAAVLNVLIASPSDVTAEREAVASAIHEWNSNHHARTGIMLHPVRWETHSYPAVGGRPQSLVNQQIVDSGHFLIGIFGSRAGTPTGLAPSGTIEEIERFRQTGRYVAIYFSTAPAPQDADQGQLDALIAYQQELKRDSLYFTFNGPDELRRLVTQHLPNIIVEVSGKLRSGQNEKRSVIDAHAQTLNKQRAQRNSLRLRNISLDDELDPKEIELIRHAATDANGEILHSFTFDGEGIRSNGRHFLEEADTRGAAEWLTAFRRLESRGFIEPLSEARDFFRVTGEGYTAADMLDEFARWNTSSIILRARYMGSDSDEVTVTCTGVIAIPPTYYDDQVGADGTVMRSLKQRRTLIVEGIKTKLVIAWEPNEVEFLDLRSGLTERFRVEGISSVHPNSFRLPISG